MNCDNLNNNIPNNIVMSLPKEILLSYFYRFNNISYMFKEEDKYIISPIINLSKNLDDYLLEDCGYDKETREMYIEYLQNVFDSTLDKKVDARNMTLFMSSLLKSSFGDSYDFFVNTDIPFSDVYVIKNKDIAGIKKLKNPKKAIDKYMFKLFSNMLNTFNFDKYLQKIPNKPKFNKEIQDKNEE